MDDRLTIVTVPRRPKEHHVHDILYFVKTAFKQRALDKLNEMDVVNKEAFKYVLSPCLPIFSEIRLTCRQAVSPSCATLVFLLHFSPLFDRYTENRPSFTALAQQSSQLSQSPSALYDAPSSRKAYSFRFAPTDPEQVNKVLETLSIQTPSRHSS